MREGGREGGREGWREGEGGREGGMEGEGEGEGEELVHTFNVVTANVHTCIHVQAAYGINVHIEPSF